ncbi:MAG: hypothetical protein Q9226_002404 [Calogaya cf. arnoldii]
MRKTVGTSKSSNINSDGSLTDEPSDDLTQATRKVARKDDELLEKISALESEVMELQEHHRRICESVVSLKAVGKATAQSAGGQSAPVHSEAIEQKQQAFPSDSKSMPLTHKIAIDKFFDEHGNDEIHRENAAGLVAAYVHARNERLLTRELRRCLIQPVPEMLRSERLAHVWAKVINSWLKDIRTAPGSGLDGLLDPCVLSAVETMVATKGREWDMVGSITGFHDAMTGYRKEVDHREKDKREARG